MAFAESVGEMNSSNFQVSYEKRICQDRLGTNIGKIEEVERCPQDSSVAGPHAEGASAGNLRSLQLGTTAFSSPRQAQKRVTLPRQSPEAGRKASLSIALFCASTLFCVGNQRVPIGDEGAVRTPDSDGTTHFCVPTQKCRLCQAQDSCRKTRVA